MTDRGDDPVAGAPVFLETLRADSPGRSPHIRTTRTDLRGEYHFAGLAPGQYRVLSSFEFEQPDEAALQAAAGPRVTLNEADNTVLDLDLYEGP